MQTVRSAVRSLPLLELPAGLIPEADAGVVPLRRNKGFWVGAAAAAVALVIAIAAIVTIDAIGGSRGVEQSLRGARFA